jgi:hypothetical protein
MQHELGDRTLRAKPVLHPVYRVCGRPGHNDRPPMPAGHPISWRLLTDGTTLEGATYPFPVFTAHVA